MDLLIRGATVYDGTGAPGRLADVGVRDGRVDAIGDLSGEAAGTQVDGRGLALAPGFIDVHSHDDFAVFLMPEMDFKVGQGVTTSVVGNCGLGAAPFEAAQRFLPFFDADTHRDRLPNWGNYGDYLDAIDADPPSINVAVLVGHGTLRLQVMGNERRAPSDGELAGMLDMLATGLDAGCVGYSSGLVYEPGRYSETEELVTLAQEMARIGGVCTSHMRNEADGLLDAVRETISIGEHSGVPVQISHHKASGRSAWGLVRESLGLIEQARSRGVDVTADQYPYTAGSTGLFAVLQNYEEQAQGMGAVEWDRIRLASSPRHPEWERRSIAELASELDTDPVETARIVVDTEGYGAVVVMETMNEDDVRAVMAHPTTMIGSDGIPALSGKPHPRLYGTFPRVLGRYVRELHVLPIEEALHRMTGMPAAKFGLTGRGVLEPGAFADLVLFDAAMIGDVATYDAPRQHASGIAAVWVNGTCVMRDGVHTGERPGAALRRAGA